MRELVRNHERWSQLSADDRAELLLQSAPERLRDPEVAFIACVRLLALPHEKMPSTLRGALQKLRSVLLARLTAPVQEMLWGAQPKRPRGRPSIWLAPKNRVRLAYYYRYLVKVLADWDGPPDRDWLIHELERLFFGSRCRPPTTICAPRSCTPRPMRVRGT